jgi:hypothetical protein
MSFKKTTLTLFLIIILTAITAAAVTAEEVQRSPRFNINGITGDDFIGQAGILYPFKNTEDSLWYTDFRYRMSADDVDEWNLGIGYRYKLDNAENHVAGAYLFRDRREEYDYDWDMWTLGGEILTDQWDFRLNGYITEDEVLSAPELDEVVVKSRRLIYQQGAYASMNGLDIEVGKRFTDAEGIFNNVGIYAKLYRFFESSTDTMTGRQLRVDKQFGERDKTTWNLGLEWRDDNTRGSDTEATFAVSIPFGADSETEGEEAVESIEYSSEEILEARMTEQPKRDLDIVVGESDALQSDNEEDDYALDYSGGVELGTVWYVTADGDGVQDGSRENPLSITEISENYYYDAAKRVDKKLPGENDVIILLGDDGVMELGKINLMSGQKLLSPGGYITVAADAQGSRKTQFRPEGKRAELNFDLVVTGSIDEIEANGLLEYPSLIILDDNTVVSGLKINTAGYYDGNIIAGYGVNGEINVTNNIIYSDRGMVTPENIRTSDYQPSISRMGNAVQIYAQPDEKGNTSIKISGNDISANRSGVFVETGFNDLNNAIGIAILDPLVSENLNINISNNQINNAVNYGINIKNYGYKNSTINVSDNNIKDVASLGYGPQLESSELSLYDSTGIYLSNSNGESINVNINNNNIENVISFDGISSGIEVYNEGFKQINNTITNNSIKVILAEQGLAKGISVYNILNRDGNTKTKLQDNNVSKLQGDILMLRGITSSINYLPINSGILVLNMGNEANSAETIVKSNNISDNYGGGFNSGIMIDNNGGFFRVGSVEPAASRNNFEETITEISNNNINNYLAYEANIGIGISDNYSSKSNIFINNNSIENMTVLNNDSDSNLGIIVENQSFEEASLNINNNTLKDIYDGTGIGLYTQNLLENQEILNLQGNDFKNMNTGVYFINTEPNVEIKDKIIGDNIFDNEIEENNRVEFGYEK